MRLTDGRRMVYGSGSDSAPIGSAVAASCAIPGYFAPVPINGANHVDGGMYSAANLDLLADYDLDLVIVSAPMATHSAFTKTLDLPLRQFLLRQLAGEAKAVRAAGSRVVVFAPTPADISVMGINPMAPGREGPVARQVRTSTSDRIRQQNLLPGLAP
jgi:NTE family protein